MSLPVQHPSYDSPVSHLKGEVLDLEFTLDSDHRKRRRNRTTQSCLNCHTSKRKCDRKRPCQRCIQLGLTGLCVYEIDDPASRDDPSLDETTRLRNRIAELESLVRELRGKPHPRWADGNFRDGDQSDRWHSRAAKPSPPIKRGDNDLGEHDHQDRLPSIKTEAHGLDGSRLYSFNLTSPSSALRYNNYLSEEPSPPLSAYDHDRRPSYPSEIPRSSATQPYPSPSVAPSSSYHSHRQNTGSNYSGGSGGYDHEYEDDNGYSQRYSPPTHTYCNCRTNPAAVHSLTALQQQLQSTTAALRQFAPHAPDSQCLLYQRITQLNSLIHQVGQSVSYSNGGALPTPETDVMSPISATSSPFDPPPTNNGADWGAIAAAGYNPYFPMHTNEQQSMYTN
ncbi:hypothetical protein FIBSPDRAFT_762805 [Athelia psychrophila]|uniref:Zn(2)-C6 fungal-type domain-containing protein n=1 Tax=Athelia psychrophila TaxID=1759441 RepID=A0A167XS56_9AGAM|nr:hypothetical protein FIBSPDRAFT_762805 [Fibularhizoctonia sp. CBS 109695]